MTAALSAVTAAEKVPTVIPVTTPLASKPPAGKTFIFMKCDTATCVPLSQGMQQAAQALGWTYRTIDYQSANPASLLSALQQALNYHPVAVAVSGIPPADGWSSVIPRYTALGIPIVASYLSGLTYSSTLIGDIAGPDTYTKFGQLLADWFIVNSHGAGTVINQRVDSFPILKTVSDAFAATVQADCPDCKVINLESSIADATSGAIVPAVISDLRANPSAHYVMSSDAEFLDGFDAAASAAGLNGKVQLIGQGSTVDELASLKAGTGAGAAYTGLALNYSGWAIVDLVLRHMEGMKFDPEDGGLPTQLFTKGGDWQVSSSFNEPANFESLFENLWGLG